MTDDLADVLAAALRRRISGTDDDIRRLAESLLADGPLADRLNAHAPGKCVTVENANRVLAQERAWVADRLEQAAAAARQPFLDLADRYERHAAQLNTNRQFPNAAAYQQLVAEDLRRVAGSQP
jgi:hypothetical protein